MQRLLTILVVCLVLTIAWPDSTLEGQEKAAKTLTFEVYKDAKQEFRWRLKAANGQVLATSGEGYQAKAACLHGIEAIKEGAARAKIEEVSTK